MYLFLVIKLEGQGFQKSEFLLNSHLLSKITLFQLVKADDSGNAIYLLECQAGNYLIQGNIDYLKIFCSVGGFAES